MFVVCKLEHDKLIDTRISHWSTSFKLSPICEAFKLSTKWPDLWLPDTATCTMWPKWHSIDLSPYITLYRQTIQRVMVDAVDDIASIFPKEVGTAWKPWNKIDLFPFKTHSTSFNGWIISAGKLFHFRLSILKHPHLTSQPISTRKPFNLPWRWCPSTHDLSQKLSSNWHDWL